MSRSAETKTYGSIRKVKHYGACGVILGLAALGTALSSGTVSADEVTNNATNAKQVQNAPTSSALESQESAKAKEGTLDVTVNSDKVDNAVSEAKAAGLNVVVDAPADGGTATSSSDLEKRQKEIEQNYDNQAEVVKKEADRFKEEVATRNQEIKTVKEENAKAKKDYEDAHAKYQADLKTANDRNVQIDKDNQAKHEQHLAKVEAVKSENEQIKKDNQAAKSRYEKTVADQAAKNAQIDKDNAAAKSAYESELGKWTERKTQSDADMTTYRQKMEQYRKDLEVANTRNAEIDKTNKANKDAYTKAVEARNKENEAIRKANSTAQAAYESALAELNKRNAQIDKENKAEQDKYDAAMTRYKLAKAAYEEELKTYNREVDAVKKKPILAQGNGVTLYGTLNESKRGSMDYYSDVTAVFTPEKGLEVVEGALGANSKTTLTLDKDLQEDPNVAKGLYGNTERLGGKIITGIKQGSTFTLHNVGRTTTGKTISARLVSRTTPSKSFDIPGNKDTYTRLWVWWYKDGSQGPISPIGFNPYNYLNNEWDIHYYDEATGRPLNLGTTTIYADLDYTQAVRHTYNTDEDTGAVINPPGSEVARTTYKGKQVWMGIHSDGTHTSDDDTGLKRWKAGDPYYTDVNDFFDTPKGTILTVGKGAVHKLTYLAEGLRGTQTYTEAQAREYRRVTDYEDKFYNRKIQTDFELYAAGYAFQLWGGKSVVKKLVPPEVPNPPEVPELKQKEKDTLNKPVPTPEKPPVEGPTEVGHVPLPKEPPKPSEFTEKKPNEPEYKEKDKTPIVPPVENPLKPLPTETPDVPHVPLPPAPPKPVEKPVPTPIAPRTIHVRYALLKTTPEVEKYVKNNLGANINKSNVPKMSEVVWELETKPLPRNREVTEVYEIHDDLPQGYHLNLAKTQAQNSDYTITYDESAHRLTGVLKKSGIDKVNANLSTAYNVPVLKVYGEVTNDNAVYKNNFHLNLNNKYEAYSNIVEVTTPGGTKPVKVNYNKDGVKIDGKQVLAGSTNYYHVTMDYSKYKDIKSGSDAIQKGFGVVEDYPEEALDIERGEIRAFDSNGAEVKGITEYHFNSIEEVKDPKIKAILETSGIKPKGAFQVFMADNPQEFFDKYVSKGNSVTIVDPMRVKQSLDRKGASYQNTAYQVDFGNGYQADIVENRVPKTDPHKKNLNAKGVDINGKQVLAGSTNYYTLTADYSDYKGIEAEKDRVAKGFYFVDDYPEEAVDIDTNGIKVVDSKGQAVKGYTSKVYKSVADAPKEVQDALKLQGYQPKGAIQVIEFENRTEFYNKYVRAGEVLTLTVPMTVKAHLNQTGAKYENTAYQLDFGSAKVTETVVNSVPAPKPNKANFNAAHVNINGKQVLAGSTNYYELTVRYDQYKGIEADEDKIQNGFFIADDYPEDVVSINEKDVKVLDSKGNEVEGLKQTIYKSLADAPEKVQKAFAKRNIQPKGAIQVFEAVNPVAYYNKYVKTGETLTVKNPMTVSAKLNQTGAKYQNTAYQLDFGLIAETETVSNSVPKTNPHKKNLNKAGVSINGKPVVAGTVNYYTLTADYSAYKGIEADANRIANGFHIVDDFPEEAVSVNDKEIVVKDSKGNLVTGLKSTIYKTLADAPKGVQESLKSAGYTPKGAIQVLTAENPTEFYNKYVKTGEVLTITNPMTVRKEMLGKVAEYKNTAYQLDFGLAMVTETVVNKVVKPNPKKANFDKVGVNIDGKQVFAGSTNYYHVTADYSQYKGIQADKSRIAQGFFIADDYPEDVLDVLSDGIKLSDSKGQEVKGLKYTIYESIEKAPEVVRNALIERGFKPKGAFQVWEAENPEEFYAKYVQTGDTITIINPMKVKEQFGKTGGKYENTAYQIDFGVAEVTTTVVNNIPKFETKKDVVISIGDKESKDGKKIALGQTFYYSFAGTLIPSNRANDLFEYKFVDDYQETHDRFDGKYKVIAKRDFVTADGKHFKAGDDLTTYAWLKEDKAKGQLEVGLKEEFLRSITKESEFQADVFVEMTRIQAGEVENKVSHIVNGIEVSSNTVKTHTDVPPTPTKPTPKTPQLPNTGGGDTAALSVGGYGLLALLGLSFLGRKRKEDK